MRIVSFQPYITEMLAHFGASSRLVGVSHRCAVKGEGAVPRVVTDSGSPVSSSGGSAQSDDARLAQGLCGYRVNVAALVDANPDVILTRCVDEDPAKFISWAEPILEKRLGHKVAIRSFAIESLAGLYRAYEDVGAAVGKGREGRDLAQRTRAQIQEWTQSFYERMRNKKVTVLAGVKPLALASGLIPDLVKAFSGSAQDREEGKEHLPLDWDEVVRYRPDVIIVAPQGASLEESVRALKVLEAFPDWEVVPAVKRGEVAFCSGETLYDPGPRFVQSAAVVVSAMSAMDSGYITKKDEFFRLRFIECHRHRFV